MSCAAIMADEVVSATGALRDITGLIAECRRRRGMDELLCKQSPQFQLTGRLTAVASNSAQPSFLIR
jgi:hypothetical protein